MAENSRRDRSLPSRAYALETAGVVVKIGGAGRPLALDSSLAVPFRPRLRAADDVRPRSLTPCSCTTDDRACRRERIDPR